MWRAFAQLARPGRFYGRTWQYCAAAGGAAGLLGAGLSFARADSGDYEAAMSVLDAHFQGRGATTVPAASDNDDNPWAKGRGGYSGSSRPGSSSSSSRGGRRVLRIGFLQCEELKDFLSPEIFNAYGGYYKMNCTAFDYVTSLSPSALASHGVTDPLREPVQVEFDVFNCQAGQFPSMSELDNYDGFYITGSLAGVYEFDQPWIRKLNDWTAEAHARGAKLMGISYGHQMIVQALGGVVGTNPNGSSVSIMSTKLTPAAQRYFGTDKPSFTLLYHHNDAILQMPPASKGLIEMGGNNVTANNGVFDERGTVLTFCGHPDYSHSPPVLHELFRIDSEKKWVGDQLLDFGTTTVYDDTDYVWVIHQIVKFWLGQLP